MIDLGNFYWDLRSWISSNGTYLEGKKVLTWKRTFGMWRESSTDVAASDFQLIFGFSPLHKGGFEQDTVNGILADRARSFDYCSSLEIEAKKSTAGSIQARQKAVIEAEEKLTKAKDTFWAASKVARDNGFEVRESFKHYLASR